MDWHVEWCDPVPIGEEEEEEEAFFTEGEAVYLLRLMNSLICFPIDESTGKRIANVDPVQVTCDANLRLLKCCDGLTHPARRYDNKVSCSGVYDFERLVTEGVVDWSGEVRKSMSVTGKSCATRLC